MSCIGSVPIVGGIANSVLGYSGAGKAGKAVQTGYENALENQRSGYDKISSDLLGQRSLAQGAINESRDAGINSINSGLGYSLEALQKGFAEANSNIDSGASSAIASQNPYAALGSSAAADYQNRLGLGDATNSDTYGELNRDFNINDLNQNIDPGYQFRKQEEQAALSRKLSAQGKYISGEGDTAYAKLSQDLASQEAQAAYQRYQEQKKIRTQNLMNAVGVGQPAANNISNIYTGQGTAKANLASGLGTGQSALYADTAKAKADLEDRRAQLLNNNTLNSGSQFATATQNNATALNDLLTGKGDAKGKMIDAQTGAISKGIDAVSTGGVSTLFNGLFQGKKAGAQ